MVGLLESLCMFYMVSQRQSGSARLRCINCSSPDGPLYRLFYLERTLRDSVPSFCAPDDFVLAHDQL